MAGNIIYNTETKKPPNAINNIYDFFLSLKINYNRKLYVE